MTSVSLIAALAAALATAPVQTGPHTIAGRVRSATTGQPLPHALVILQSAHLVTSRDTETDDAGLYRFDGLPAGVYVVNVLAGQADLSKVVTVGAPR